MVKPPCSAISNTCTVSESWTADLEYSRAEIVVLPSKSWCIKAGKKSLASYCRFFAWKPSYWLFLAYKCSSLSVSVMGDCFFLCNCSETVWGKRKRPGLIKTLRLIILAAVSPCTARYLALDPWAAWVLGSAEPFLSVLLFLFSSSVAIPAFEAQCPVLWLILVHCVFFQFG